jgi:hypothetical protein
MSLPKSAALTVKARYLTVQHRAQCLKALAASGVDKFFSAVDAGFRAQDKAVSVPLQPLVPLGSRWVSCPALRVESVQPVAAESRLH